MNALRLIARLVLIVFWGGCLCSFGIARDRVRVGFQLEPPSLDPTATAAATAGEITYCNVLEGLTVVDGQGKLSPRLATRWSLSADGLTYTFFLREGVVFHDGKPFNAQTAVYSLERIGQSTPPNPQKQWFAKIASVKAIAPNVLTIGLSQPDALLPFALALPAAVMVHPDSVPTNDVHPVGTGPFAFIQWDRTRYVQLERFDNYWGKRPAISGAQLLFMHTTAETENALAEGLVDGLASVTKVTNQFLVRPDYRMVSRKLESKMILAINNRRAPFDNLQVRRAISHAIDREKISQLYGPQLQVEPIGSHFSPSHPAYVNLVDRYPFDPSKARAMLAKAKVPKGLKIELKVPPTDYGRYGGLLVASDLEAVGFKVDLIPLDWPLWMSEVFEKKNYALTLIMHVEPMDIGIYARDNYYFNYDNAAFKTIWQKVLHARSEVDLNRMLGQAQQRIAEDAVNVFLFIRPEKNFIHKDLTGVWEKSPIPSFVLEDLAWTK